MIYGYIEYFMKQILFYIFLWLGFMYIFLALFSRCNFCFGFWIIYLKYFSVIMFLFLVCREEAEKTEKKIFLVTRKKGRKGWMSYAGVFIFLVGGRHTTQANCINVIERNVFGFLCLCNMFGCLSFLYLST